MGNSNASIERFEHVISISKTIRATPDQPPAFDRVIALIKEKLNYERVALYLLDEHGERLICVADTVTPPAAAVAEDSSIAITADSPFVQVVRSSSPLQESNRIITPIISTEHCYGALSAQGMLGEDDSVLLCALASHIANGLENERLLNEAAQRAKEMDAIIHASLGLAASLELSDVLDKIVQSAFDLMKSTSFAHVFVYENDVLKFGSGWSTEGRHSKPVSDPRPGGITYTVAQNGEVIAVSDMATHQLFSGKGWSGAIIGLPLKFGARVVGVMNFSYADAHDFTEAEIRVLRLLADQAAIAIENAHLYSAAKQRASELDTALQASLGLTASLELSQVLDRIVQSTFNLLNKPRDVHVFLYESEVLIFGSGWHNGGRQDKPISQPRKDGMTYKIAETGESIIVNDMQKHPLYMNTPWHGAIVGLPLKIGTRVVGVMNFTFAEAREFSERDLHVFRLLGDQAAIAIENARLYTSAQQEIAERKNAEEALSVARDQALEASRAKSSFLANMSHELRTPLNAIIGYSEILLEDAQLAKQETMLEDLENIHSSGKHLLGIINDILDLSKIEAGKLSLNLETFEVEDVIRSVSRTVEPLVRKKTNTFEIHFENEAGRIYADATRLRQSLLNLLSNAAKFTENGTIKLNISRDATYITFAISDTGIGLTPEQQSNLFQAFTQADGSTTRKYGGTGLGLTITKHFCEMMGGNITVKSQYRVGSTFTISLPVKVVAPATLHTTPPPRTKS